MILGQFFGAGSAEAAAIEVASWLRVLAGCGAEEILTAWEAYQADGPRSRSGAPRKPTAHELRRRVMRERARRNPAPRVEAAPERREPRVTAEQAARILEEYGFGRRSRAE